MKRLTLDAASIILDAALAEARRLSLEPVCVAVLDAGAHLVALKRETEASLLRPQIAIGKATGALGMGFGSREIARRSAQAPAFFNAVAVACGGMLIPWAGGVLIRNADGLILGAVGVSGDKPDADEACALAGIAAAGLAADRGAAPDMVTQ